MAGRLILMILLLGGLARPQSAIESAAIAAGSTAGSIAGKKVSDGITKLMNQAAGAAAKAGQAPLLQAGPASARQAPASAKAAPLATRPVHDNVPPPPPLRAPQKARAEAVQRSEQPAAPEPAGDLFPIIPQTFPPPPPLPVMTEADFAAVKAGMRRDQVLELGRNAVRITSTADGHVEEIFHYRDGGNPLGVVRIVDGTVTRVDARP